MRVLVTGSRNWDLFTVIWDALNELNRERDETMVLIHGGARGADEMAERCAITLGWHIECYPADWKRLGRKAGVVRNQRMVDKGADVCLAFPMPDSRGTFDCIERAKRAGIEVKQYAP